MVLKVGLTGNIGSGKSLIAKIFETLQIPVFYADTEGKKILDQPEVIPQLRQIFGANVVNNGTVNRPELAKIVFAEKKKLEQLNKIIHPAVRTHFAQWAEQQLAPYVIYEAAILFESGHYNRMDKVVVVAAEEALRIRRVMDRDQVSAENVKQRMANQWPETKKMKLGDYVIDNNENRLLIPQVLEVHSRLCSLMK